MTVLIDTSIWADHFRKSDALLIGLLGDDAVLIHPFVVGELAMGNLADRARTTAALAALPALDVVPQDEWLAFVDRHALFGSGLGFVDAHLLAAASLQHARLWTRDRRLAERAATLGLDWAA